MYTFCKAVKLYATYPEGCHQQNECNIYQLHGDQQFRSLQQANLVIKSTTIQANNSNFKNSKLLLYAKTVVILLVI